MKKLLIILIFISSSTMANYEDIPNGVYKGDVHINGLGWEGCAGFLDKITVLKEKIIITGRSITTGTPWRSSFKKNEKKPLKFYIEGGESFNYKITYMDYILEDDSSTVISIIYFKIIDKASQCRGEGRYLLSNK